MFRGWYDFGTGALGDMGHYSFHQIFEVLNSAHPPLWRPAEARSGKSKATNGAGRIRPSLIHTPPRSTGSSQRMGERPPVTLHWYDGSLRPPTIPELEADGQDLPEEGLLFVGDEGKILSASAASAREFCLTRAGEPSSHPPNPCLAPSKNSTSSFARAAEAPRPMPHSKPPTH